MPCLGKILAQEHDASKGTCPSWTHTAVGRSCSAIFARAMLGGYFTTQTSSYPCAIRAPLTCFSAIRTKRVL
jgi:hypothetical protein